jgi:ParB family transcriptional regulator, chromosome partitioning protein
MTTAGAAEKVAGVPVEKRRALGRGLESLLPGPRRVSPEVRVPSAEAQGAGVAPVHYGGTGGGFSPEGPVGTKFTGDIQAVVEDATEADTGGGDAAGTRTGVSAPHEQHPQHETITIHAQAESRTPSNLVVNIPIDHIEKNPYQTRYDFNEDTLEELAESIKVNGLVQPIVVRPGEEEGRYILVLGERRLRASKMAGKSSIPAMVKRVSEQQAAEMTIVENLQREDLNCIEQAEAFRVLSKEFNLTQQQIGDRVGMSRESVSNYMRLLKLTQRSMEHLLAGRIGFSEARELLKLEDPAAIEKAADHVVKHQLKFEQVETMVARMTGWLDPVPGLPVIQKQKKGGGARWMDPNVKAAQMDLERLLQVRVRIRDKKGRGKIVIEYHTVDDYERVVEALRGKK